LTITYFTNYIGHYMYTYTEMKFSKIKLTYNLGRFAMIAGTKKQILQCAGVSSS